MNYNIIGMNLDLSAELREYVDARLSHIEKFLPKDDAVQLDIELAFHPGDAAPKYRAEFTLANGKHVYRAEAQGSAMHEAIDVALGELQRELSRAKDKRVSGVRRGALRMKEFLRGWRS